MNRTHITSTEFKDIYAVAEFVYKLLPDNEMWIDCYDDKGNKLDVELRKIVTKIVTNKLRKEIEINKRINDLEKDFEY